MPRVMNPERILLAVLTVGALALLPEADRVGLWMRGNPGPGFYPAALLVAIAAVSAALWVAAAPRTSAAAVRAAPRDLLLPAVAAALVTAPLMLSLTGFRLTGFVYTFALMVAMSPRRTPLSVLVLALVAIGATLAFNQLFGDVFRIYLPRGRLTGF